MYNFIYHNLFEVELNWYNLGSYGISGINTKIQICFLYFEDDSGKTCFLAPTNLYSSNIQAGRKNNVALYCIGSSFHLLVQGRVTHNSRSIFKFTACFIQSDDGSHYQAFRYIRQLTDICERSALREGRNMRWQTMHKATASLTGQLQR